MIIEILHSGIRISAMVNGYRESKLFIGYSKREAIANFKRIYNI